VNPTVTAAGRTHIGLVRRRNQDAWYVGRHLFAVADGLGGHAASDVASRTVIDILRPYDQPSDPANLAAVAGRAIHTANVALSRKLATDLNLAGMASTLVALLCSGSAAVLANVGDSRAYLLRDGKIVQITEDHNCKHLVADAAAVPDLPQSLCRYLDGRSDGRSPDLTCWTLRPGDRFLLCSDGLSSYVPQSKIHDTLALRGASADAADQLITLGLNHGGRDNITVVVVDVPA
jgi:PPM family protein phosphatase